MSLDKKNLKGFKKNRELIECTVSKASNYIMLNRISGGREIEFPFCSFSKELKIF